MIRSILRNFPKEFSEFLDFHITRLFKGSRYALNELDVKLEKFIKKNNGYFVELGANNGFKQSNTLYLEHKFGWSGLLIEPSPENYKKCLYYRSNKNTIICCACVPDDYHTNLVWLEDAGLMTLALSMDTDHSSVSSFLKSGHALAHTHNENPLRYAVEARTLSSCLDQAQAPKVIDLLSLDVEGAELSVLRGVDFEKFIFKHIIVECRSIEKMENFLSEKGYKLLEKLSYHDYLFAFRGAE